MLQHTDTDTPMDTNKQRTTRNRQQAPVLTDYHMDYEMEDTVGKAQSEEAMEEDHPATEAMEGSRSGGGGGGGGEPSSSVSGTGTVVNHDQCDSCGDGGDLICCDNCPRSFHFDCINPPINQAEAFQLKEWYCPSCRAARTNTAPQVHGTVLRPLLTKLRATNPQTFTLPPEIQGGHNTNSVECSSARDNSTPLAEGAGADVELTKPRKRGPKPKPKEEQCFYCSQGGELISCCVCNSSYHLYCLEPPLLEMPENPLAWQCPNHEELTEVLPEKKFKLDFATSNRLKRKRDEQENDHISSQKQNGNTKQLDKSLEGFQLDCDLGPSEYEQTNWLLSLSAPRNNQPAERLGLYSMSNSSLALQIEQLQAEQEKLLRCAMPSGNSFNSPLAATTSIILSQLTPLFTQFLAWQRLMQIYQEIQEKKQQQQIPETLEPNTTGLDVETYLQTVQEDYKAPARSIPSRPVRAPRVSVSPPPSKKPKIAKRNPKAKSPPQPIIEANKGRNRGKIEKPKPKHQKEPDDQKPKAKSKENLQVSTPLTPAVTPTVTPAPSPTALPEPAVSLDDIQPPLRRMATDPSLWPPCEAVQSDPRNPLARIERKRLVYLSITGSVEDGTVLYEDRKDFITIGRKKHVDIDCSNLAGSKTVSRKHASIAYSHSLGAYIWFTVGRNGTKVDGVLFDTTTPAKLKPTVTHISIGKLNLTFRVISS